MHILSKIKHIRRKTVKGLNRLFIVTGYAVSFVLCIFLVRHHLPSHPARVLVLEHTSTPLSFWEEEPTLWAWKTSLYRALEDRHLKRVVIRLDSHGSFSIADAQSFRALLLKLKAQGKEVICYSDSLGTLGGTNLAAYLIGSCANKLYVSDTGSLFFEGLNTERLYFGQCLKDLGIHADMIACGKYKSGPDGLTRSNMSLEERQTLRRIFSEWEKHIVKGLLEDRRVAPALLKQGIYTLTCSGAQAKTLGWVDDVVSCWNEIEQRYIAQEDSITCKTYSRPKKGIVRWIKDTLSHRHHIALMRIEGELGSSKLDHETYCKELVKLSKNDAVKAVMILVNTPGGTTSASETLRYGIDACRKAGKSTIVVMESIAASGGYWLACAADKIWAQPGTLTGSIGIYGGKFDVEEALKKWHIGHASVGSREHTHSSVSSNQHWTLEQKERWQKVLSGSYRHFCTLVAQSRKLSLSKVEAIAQGQVWTGEEAKALGLVDELGDFWDARAWAKKTLPGLKHLETIEYTPENCYSLKWLLSTLSQRLQSVLHWAYTQANLVRAQCQFYTR